MPGNPLLKPIAEENSKQSEEAIFQEYDHDTFLNNRFSSEDEDNKNKNYIRLNEIANDWYCSGKFLLVILAFIILMIILIILVYNRII